MIRAGSAAAESEIGCPRSPGVLTDGSLFVGWRFLAFEDRGWMQDV